ncbi:MAG: hypothetical protein ACQCN6_00295 [Candidatus Bathyarchaeia archaeon]|jgi:hypothetical protein
MKYLKGLAIIALMLVATSVLQPNLARAASTTIISATPLDPWGNPNTLAYRGHPAGVNLTLNSDGGNTSVRVFITLIDRDNVAVGAVSTSAVVSGQTSLTLNFSVASYAFVGTGRYIITVTDTNLKPIATLTVPVNISILGDFNFSGRVDFQDILNFVDAFCYYNQHHEIPSSNKKFDINGDQKIDFNDMLIFSAAFADFN